MNAIFILGFLCGAAIGSWASWMALTWFHPVDVEEAGVSLFPIDKEKK